MKANDIIIDYIHFHYVESGKVPTSQPSGGVETVDSDLHRIYSKFIVDIANRPESNSSYDLFEQPPSIKQSTRKTVETMLKRPIPQEKKQFVQSATALAEKLIGLMPAAAKPGVLFQILFRIGGRRSLCFLKLAWVDQTWSVYHKASEKLQMKQLVQALPARGKFQKGAIYPHPDHPSSAYMRVYQRDYAEADYFEKFLEGLHEITGGDAMDELVRLAEKVAGPSLTMEQHEGLYQGLETHLGQTRKAVEANDIVRIVQAALPSFSKTTVKNTVSPNVTVTGIISASQVADLKITFNVGGLTVLGSYIDVIHNFRQSPRGSDQHIIRGRISGIKRWKR